MLKESEVESFRLGHLDSSMIDSIASKIAHLGSLT